MLGWYSEIGSFEARSRRHVLFKQFIPLLRHAIPALVLQKSAITGKVANEPSNSCRNSSAIEAITLRLHLPPLSSRLYFEAKTSLLDNTLKIIASHPSGAR